MSEEAETNTDHKPTLVPVYYDADARNRFEYVKDFNGSKYDIAQIFGTLDDERYMKWQRDLNVRGNEDDMTEEFRESSEKLWNDIISEVDGYEFPEGADWKSLIDRQDKIGGLNDFLAVAIVEPEASASGKLKVGEVAATQTVITEAWFNGIPVEQTHTLNAKTLELEKKFERIIANQAKPEKTRGLRRKAKIEFVPQDHKLGELYDEMLVRSEGFQSWTPLRFKVVVMKYIFAPRLTQKPLGKS